MRSNSLLLRVVVALLFAYMLHGFVATTALDQTTQFKTSENNRSDLTPDLKSEIESPTETLFATSTLPNSPSFVTQQFGTSNSIGILFDNTNLYATIPCYYRVCILELNFCQNITGADTSLTAVFENLQLATIYNISIVTENVNQEKSEMISTLAMTGLTAPSNISLDIETDFAIITWKPVNRLLSTNVLYELIYQQEGRSDRTVFTVISNSKLLLNLEPATPYIYSIRSIASYKSALINSSDIYVGNFTTVNGEAPSGSPTIYFVDVSETSILVSLRPIPINQIGRSTILDYTIEYSKSMSDFFEDHRSVTISAGAGVYDLSNLNSGTIYYVRARGRNTLGYSPYSPTITVRTKETVAYLELKDAVAVAVAVIVSVSLILIAILCLIVIVSVIVIAIATMKKKNKLAYSNNQFNGVCEKELKNVNTTFKIQFEELSFENSIVLGSGAQGTVCTAKYKGAVVAVKMFPKSVMGVEKNINAFLTEVKFLATHCNHSNLIRLIGVAEDTIKHKLCIITELCTGGNLATFIEKNKTSFKAKVSLLRGIASGMSYLHSNNIVHRDLKCENVLLDASGTIPKIIDFGLSRQIEQTNQTLHLTMNVGTATYLAPEIIKLELQQTNALQMNTSSVESTSVVISEESFTKQLQYDIKADVYSFAIIMFVLYFENKNPYGNTINELQLMYHISQNPNFRPKIIESKVISWQEHGWYLNLMKECWSSDPNQRPSFQQIIQIIDTANI